MNTLEVVKIGSRTVEARKCLVSKAIGEYGSMEAFVKHLDSFVTWLFRNKNSLNINPYDDLINRGIYVLGGQNLQFSIFPSLNLAFKCSLGGRFVGGLRREYLRSLYLSYRFEKNSSKAEHSLLQVCPCYLYYKDDSIKSGFKEVVFMHRVLNKDKNNTFQGFSFEFCMLFGIPSVVEIEKSSKFAIHRLLDSDKNRQLIKIQTVYLLRRLWQQDIKIMSLNQKNILVTSDEKSERDKYIIIDPIADYFIPATPVYNAITSSIINLVDMKF